MTIDHWALPFTSIEGKLLGIELESHEEHDGVRLLRPSDEVLTEQLRLIESKATWFQDNGLLCVLSSGTGEIPKNLPFIRQMTTTSRTHDCQWLDDLGAHGSSAIPLVSGDFEVARLNKRYTLENIDRLIFPVLLKSIIQYCERVIVPVQDKTYHQMLKAAGVWGIQGEYKPIRFEHCEKLL